MALAFPSFLCRSCQQCRSARHHRAFSTTHCSWSPARNSSYYELLGVKQDATPKEIKQAFFSKSKKLHPDSNPADPELHSQFVKLNEAYRVLSKQSSRKHYDSSQAAHDAWAPPASHSSSSSSKRSPFGSTDFGTRSKSEPGDNTRYWQQFHGPFPFSGPEWQKRHSHNRRLFGYCVLFMMGSLVVHYVAYRKLAELHNHFMDEKDRIISEIYNKSKEQARSMGFQEQQELLRQKRAEWAQRYHKQPGQFTGMTGTSDSVKDPAPATSTAK
ncbi:dnaJ homolog subfamily C member 4 [Varanus komodoensis]|uniref:DnaJ heat shock protein family (Hsp40) member C4 n=1 Tax=Varanus komodoensis TaxID=61221 RepID=A0A8D2JAA0_VARKO|nr:dnaJ homolog subfamily C member 4 [Varanus komodoensis]XP_044304566.1 dnaJ homolog subfamily C member 4 [Varanus komodoensis]XP_044304567.1 dnaJ homolog subfamily C member 4 [Varanus komodoensis]XP_044304568.1 dnaJ homolog subfamily C member 4 [Varanus komodoensis]XP_044304569.1 dnaJ homolog subfamily C member 4 [Varanus komodoensis]XP_044304570.1 dnaJ homolog subfamily C member 4 [Varanus komodoensis]